MSTRFYDTELTDAAWAFVAPVLPAARPGGRPRATDLRAVLDAIFYLLFGVWLSDLLMNAANRSIGTGRMVVVLCSLEISFIVCKKRSCKAIGCAEIIDAACTSFSAA